MAHAPHQISPSPSPRHERVSSVDIAAWILAGAALIGVLLYELLPALLAGLLMHQLARMLAGRIKIRSIQRAQLRLIAVIVLVFGIVGLLIAGGIAAAAAVHSVTNSLPALMQQLADMIE